MYALDCDWGWKWLRLLSYVEFYLHCEAFLVDHI